MGMYDWVNYECVCDNCHAKVTEFQTKDGNRALDWLKPNDVNNFYSHCGKCGNWIEFHKIKDNKFRKVTSYRKGGKRFIVADRSVTI